MLEILFDKSSTRYFSYEKVSKRPYLDIASVNTALSIQHTDGRIETAHIAAGGVAAIPCYLTQTCTYLQGKTILEAAEIAQSEVAPISDSRGSAQYKSLLLGQLIFAHFLKLFLESINFESLNTRNINKQYGSSCMTSL